VALAVPSALWAAVAAVALISAPVASAEPGAFSDDDTTFFRLLSDPDQDHPMKIWNFPLIRYQGLEHCARESQGMRGIDSIYELQKEGPYTFDDALSIASAADVAYCPENLHPPG
jgi:hypothetical protein